MPDDIASLIRRLIGGDAKVAAEILDRAPSSRAPTLLVAAALLTDQPSDLLDQAERCAVTTRERQLVAIAAARLTGDDDLLDALVRDHLADHPDNVLVAWIAAEHANPSRATRPRPVRSEDG